MLPLYLQVNQKFGDDDDDDEFKGSFSVVVLLLYFGVTLRLVILIFSSFSAL